MTDPHEQRQAVTRAVGIVRGEGFDVSCDPRLLDRSLPVRTHDELSAGSRIGSLSQTITTAGHTREVVAALSELTAPDDGVLHAVADVLNATADWWQGLGEPADPHYANRLRYLTKQLDTYALEIRSLRGDLADRHTGHPQRSQSAAVRHAPTAPGEAIRRAQAAAASSPSRAGTRLPATPSAVTLPGSTTPVAHRRR
ncbi:hypothetical protein [Streptomyces fildesensis]|uniref:hypothetical protein n=1 Tax=Streptomyces fildesensis TaxID=375757 RepID=UPI0018DF807F|nr:hypothetical protein [Streptomyces fildesensis]